MIDPISLSPIDVQTICESVEKTGNLLIVDNGWTPCGASAEIMSLVIENVQRQDLNPIEEAQGYQRLIDDFSYDQNKVAQFIGKSRSHAVSYTHLTLPTNREV
mgnify:CR=1 FL=1